MTKGAGMTPEQLQALEAEVQEATQLYAKRKLGQWADQASRLEVEYEQGALERLNRAKARLQAVAGVLLTQNIAQAEENKRLKEALAGLMEASAPFLQRSYPKSQWGQAWFDAEYALGNISEDVHRRGSVPKEPQ